MMKQAILPLILLLTLLQVSVSMAQITYLQGQVVSKLDNVPFGQASVYVEGHPTQAVATDIYGKFRLDIPNNSQNSSEVTLRIQPVGVDFWFSQRVRLNSYPVIRLTPPPGQLLAKNVLKNNADIDLEHQAEQEMLAYNQEPNFAEINTAEFAQPVEQAINEPSTEEANSPVNPIAKEKIELFDPNSILSISLDSMAPIEKVQTIKSSLDNIKERLQSEKSSITERNTDISKAIEWISTQIENENDLSSEQRLELMIKLEELESQLLANDEAYRLLHSNTQKEIDRMKEIISEDSFWGRLNFRVILGLLFVILALSAIAYLFFTIARRFRKQRNELASQLKQINRQKEEIEQQRQKIEGQRDELVQTNHELERLQKSKEELTAMIAHDLRNPLNIILGYSNPAVTENLHQRTLVGQSRYIYQASQRINVLIDNMLDVQKYSSVGIHLQRQMHNIHQTAQKAIEDLYLFVEQKGLRIKNNIPEDLYSSYDFNIIERVFENLLTNAVKYTPSGGNILFSAKVHNPEHLEKSIVQISVSDTGEGIPKEKFIEIFEPFNQLNAKAFANTRSTGLGLTFCKLAVDAHESNLQVISEVGKGTTFYFDLPKLEIVHQDINSNQNQPSEEPSQVTDLSEAEKEYLHPYIEEMKGLELYEDTALRKVLAKLEDSNSQAIKAWKLAMQESIDSLNEAKFDSLINFA